MPTWTSASRSIADPFGRWGDDLAQAFVRLEPQRIVDAPFFGRIVKAGGGPLEISRVDAAAHRVARLKEHAVRSGEDLVFVNLQLAGVGLTTQHGKEMTTRPFDLVVADTAAPFEIMHKSRFSLYCLALPRPSVPADLLRRGCIHLSARSPGRHLARMIGDYAAMLLDEGASDEGSVYGRHIVDLIGICGRRFADEEKEGCDRSTRLAVLLDFVRQNYRDHELSAATVAQIFGISERYVHKLFAETERSFSEHLGELRLNACAEALTGGSADTIIDIAMTAGFSDISYFNRRFKSRFGETPSSYRRRGRNP